MKLIGEPKEKVKASGGIDDARQALEDAGMELNDEELDKVAGGWPLPRCSEPLQPYGEIV